MKKEELAKIKCWDKVCECWVDDFKVHKVVSEEGDSVHTYVSINEVWATSDVELYVSLEEYEKLGLIIKNLRGR